MYVLKKNTKRKLRDKMENFSDPNFNHYLSMRLWG